jgi:hypothetical protein
MSASSQASSLSGSYGNGFSVGRSEAKSDSAFHTLTYGSVKWVVSAERCNIKEGTYSCKDGKQRRLGGPRVGGECTGQVECALRMFAPSLPSCTGGTGGAGGTGGEGNGRVKILAPSSREDPCLGVGGGALCAARLQPCATARLLGTLVWRPLGTKCLCPRVLLSCWGRLALRVTNAPAAAGSPATPSRISSAQSEVCGALCESRVWAGPRGINMCSMCMGGGVGLLGRLQDSACAVCVLDEPHRWVASEWR